ncbi:RNA-binding domain-containing protein [Mycena vulgaris]|nr:RNA-binding domain-containing protein [Mycena vulgaris]
MQSPGTPPPASTSTSLEDHLSYPTFSVDDAPEPSTSKAPPQPRQTLQDRLYIGNLHPSVDEYSLLQIFSKFGKVTKLDFLFHKTGLLRGKPRGYAFVEYGNKDDALKALGTAHDKLLRGRKLVVTFAQQAPVDPGAGPSSYGNLGSKHRKIMAESGRPTTLSMIKSGMGNRNEGTRDKIAMMEAKLRQMERSKPTQNPDAPPSSLPYHASLPAKPLPSNAPSTPPSQLARTQNEPQRQRRPPPSLPSLPFAPQPSAPTGLKALSGSTKNSAPSMRKAGGALIGVKLKKPKEKDNGGQGDTLKPPEVP